MARISIHALLAESDLKFDLKFIHRADFYPRSPCGERLLFQIIRSQGVAISIHALLAESDGLLSPTDPRQTISIHALLAESDEPQQFRLRDALEFLSTLSLRRATMGVLT